METNTHYTFKYIQPLINKPILSRGLGLYDQHFLRFARRSVGSEGCGGGDEVMKSEAAEARRT